MGGRFLAPCLGVCAGFGLANLCFPPVVAAPRTVYVQQVPPPHARGYTVVATHAAHGAHTASVATLPLPVENKASGWTMERG